MHRFRVILIAVTALFIALLSTPGAEATMESMKVLKKAYPTGKASCVQCHTGKVGKGGDLNAYGMALVESKGGEGQAVELTVEDLQAIENDDADGDGVSNKEELEAGTDPGVSDAAEPEARLDVEKLNLYSSLIRWIDNTLTPDLWAEEAMAKAEYVGSEMCMACHTEEAEAYERSSHANISLMAEGLEVTGCESCHGPGSLHVEAGGGKGVGGLIDPNEHPDTCFQCHMDKKLEFKRPYRHPVMEGKMSCSDCHSPHGVERENWAAEMFDEVNADCARCHKEQTQPYVFEHEALREGCTSCHNPHGSIHDKMLVVRDANVCLRCHAQVDHPNIGDRSHSGFLNNGTCFSAGCHTAVHGSSFSDHLRY